MNTIGVSSTINCIETNRRFMKDKLDMFLQSIFIVATIVSASCLVYVVMFLDALRKGWLV